MFSLFQCMISSIYAITLPLTIPYSKASLNGSEFKWHIIEINLNCLYFSLGKTFSDFDMVLFSNKSSRLKTTVLEKSGDSSPHQKAVTEHRSVICKIIKNNQITRNKSNKNCARAPCITHKNIIQKN